ncbi:DeoR C terminal sensor domain-containing protein [Quadrisphaera granulorum]|uniref:DeoR C terminal sensor domain-containing protein n=1 Tax=Quadrisphaera granulorum TaxID=317664 RepID=A0A316AI05_9ACTN|nr:hypothetical protein [Quadrisphaera granulorum]PWJ49537.1 DeoR C terminal sensor domain-containing protein [Quadrisphaera granulorum]SZE98116.1 DeoR C terminal sensor domain-containing protein [Quadrisphaera granulorum]
MELGAKAAIGRAAAALLRPGQTVVIDVGTTAVEVARAVPGDFHGVVATSSLRVAGVLAGRSGIEVLVAGGRVREGDLAVCGAQAVAFFDDLCPDIAFVGSGGVSASGLTDYHLDEAASRRVMISRSARSYALVDHSKIGRTAPYRVCGLEQLSGIITDRQPNTDQREVVDAVAELLVATPSSEL